MEKTLREIRNSNETPEQRKARFDREYQKRGDHCANCGKLMLFGIDTNPLCGQCQKLEKDREVAENNNDKRLDQELEDAQMRLAEDEKKLAELESKLQKEKNESADGTEIK